MIPAENTPSFTSANVITSPFANAFNSFVSASAAVSTASASSALVAGISIFFYQR